MDRLQRRAKDFAQVGGRLVIVSSDAPKYLLELKQSRKLKDLTILSDDDLKLIKTFGTQEGKRRISRPATFVLDAKGRVVWRYIGNGPCDRPAESTILRKVRRTAKAQGLARISIETHTPSTNPSCSYPKHP